MLALELVLVSGLVLVLVLSSVWIGTSPLTLASVVVEIVGERIAKDGS